MVFSVVIGVGIGFECVLVTLYVTEISPSKLRGALGCVNQIMITVGILLASVGGLWWTWKDSLLWFTLPCVFQIIGMIIYAPETPRWLILQRKEESALHVLHNLRDDDQGWNVDEEFSLLSQQIKKDRVVDGFNISSLFHVLKSDSTITRALLIGFSLQIFQQGSGINAVMFNTASLFNSKISLSNQAGLLYAILVNIFQVLLTIVSSFFVDRQGRKFLLLISYTGMAVCSLLTFVFQIHVLFMVLYIGFFSIGAGPVTWIYCGEIYPPKLRSVSMSLATVVNWTMSFFVTASFGSLKEILGSDNSVFFLYGAVSCIGAYTIHFQFPETKDKTDGEIYQCLSK